MMECSICFVDCSDDIARVRCSKTTTCTAYVCENCMCEYLKICARDNQPLRCPVQSCGAMYDLRSVAGLAQDKQMLLNAINFTMFSQQHMLHLGEAEKTAMAIRAIREKRMEFYQGGNDRIFYQNPQNQKANCQRWTKIQSHVHEPVLPWISRWRTYLLAMQNNILREMRWTPHGWPCMQRRYAEINACNSWISEMPNMRCSSWAIWWMRSHALYSMWYQFHIFNRKSRRRRKC